MLLEMCFYIDELKKYICTITPFVWTENIFWKTFYVFFSVWYNGKWKSIESIFNSQWKISLFRQKMFFTFKRQKTLFGLKFYQCYHTTTTITTVTTTITVVITAAVAPLPCHHLHLHLHSTTTTTIINTKQKKNVFSGKHFLPKQTERILCWMSNC